MWPAMTYFRLLLETIIGPRGLTTVFGMGTGVAPWAWITGQILKNLGM